MIDRLISFGAGFDVISPLLSLIQNYRRRPSVRYSIPASCGWHAYAIRNMLQDSGIQLWGLALYQDTFVFSIREAQAKYAQYLLERAGLPYQGGIEEYDVTTQGTAGTMGPAEDNRPIGIDGWLARINDFVDSF